MRLTAKGVAGLQSDKVQEEFWDDLVPGLVLRVGRGGSKAYLVRYRAGGKYRRLALGKHPHLSLSDAREKAREKLAAVQEGEDPAQERTLRRSLDTTFGALAAEALREKEKGRKPARPSTMRQYRQVVSAELLPRWKDRPVTSISRRDVVELVEAIRDRGAPILANRALATIKNVFNTGLKRGFPTLEANPATLVDPPSEENGRDRYLTGEEIKVVWDAMAWETPVMRTLFRLALLTAQRMGSCAALRWKDIDEADVWRIPAGAFKGKREHWVPLSPEALAVLEELRPLTGAGEHVFPGRGDGKQPHVNSWNGAHRRVRDRTEIPSWVPHDFRTTFRTHATRARHPRDKRDPAGLGVAPHVADAVLGHKEASLGFSRYTGEAERYLLAEKREALTAWGEFVAASVKGGGR